MISLFRMFGILGIILIVLWGTWNCKDELMGEDINKIVFPDSNVSYHNHVQLLFHVGCAIPGGCHAGETPAGNLSLETWQDTRDRIEIIIPRDPENSQLVWAIEGRDPRVPQMPLYRPPLNGNQIKGIRTWIKEGAENN
ncbi:MAG: hypothetical protein QME52_09245 [Bacteroidota bacterium]|nr:hypothetical protein [Bacteroidota bacterium]